MSNDAVTHAIVVGVDESDGAADALRWASHEAELHNATLTAVMAWGLLDQHHIANADFDPCYGESQADQALREYVTRAIGDQPTANITTRAVCDLPARALLDASANADLLVVGDATLDVVHAWQGPDADYLPYEAGAVDASEYELAATRTLDTIVAAADLQDAARIRSTGVYAAQRPYGDPAHDWMLTPPPGASTSPAFRVRDDDHGTGRVLGALLAHRAQKQPGEPAPTP